MLGQNKRRKGSNKIKRTTDSEVTTSGLPVTYKILLSETADNCIPQLSKSCWFFFFFRRDLKNTKINQIQVNDSPSSLGNIRTKIRRKQQSTSKELQRE